MLAAFVHSVLIGRPVRAARTARVEKQGNKHAAWTIRRVAEHASFV
ncbi:hypothetical protein [Ancylobacter sp. G4_0304]